MPRLSVVVAVVASLLVVTPAFAQDAVVEGPGHELSEGTVIHPSAGIDFGVISNVFYEASQQIVSPVARLLLDLAIANDEGVKDPTATEVDEPPTRTPPKLEFRAGLRLTREQYLTSRDAVQEQSDFGVGASIDAQAFPRGSVTFGVRDRFQRHLSPTNFESTGNLNRDVNDLALNLVYQPTGRSMTAGLRYENKIDVFESDSAEFANRMQQTIGLRADWQYLPVTKFYFDASLGFFGALGDSTYKVGSMPLRVLLGAASALTERTTARLHVGYGNGFYESGANFSNVLFGGEFGLRYSPMGRATLAYQYGFQDSVNANFYRDHAVIAKLDQQLGLVLLGAGAQLRLRGYRGINTAVIGGPTARDDLIVRLAGTAQYLYRDWLAIVGEAILTSDQTDYRYDAGSGAAAFDPSYSRFEVWLGTRAAF